LTAKWLVGVIVTVDGAHLCNAIQVLGGCLVLRNQAKRIKVSNGERVD